MSLTIVGLGTMVPGEPVPQQRAAEVAARLFEATPERERTLSTLYRWTRVASRHSVLSDGPSGSTGTHQQFFAPWSGEGDKGPTTRERMDRYEAHAAPLALAASRSALDEAGTEPGDLTHLVTVSCSGFSAPGVDVALLKQLGLSPDIARSHIGFMGCHGALNALRVARSFVEADPASRVLVCAVELCTLHAHYGWDPEQIVANAIFSDGAAALVGAGRQTGRPDAWTVAANGSRIMADSEDAMTWRVHDHGFEMTLSPRVPDLIREHVRPWLEGWLAEQGLSMDDVGSWAIHPGGPRILDAVARAAGLDKQRLTASYEVLERYGNMSSPTILFLLKRLKDEGAALPLVALGFGPGLAIEAALIR
ncbi:MAG: type III polyketide synthase [Thermoanaerobaculia bacterium]